MLTIRQLIKYALRFEPDNSNTRFVRVTRVHKITPNVYRILTYTKIPAGVPGYPKGYQKQHIHYLKDLSDGEFTNLDDFIEVGCQCDRFKYKWEYALHRQGAALITQSNGAAAKITNPRNYPGCCKHIIVGLHHILKEAQKLQKEKERRQKQQELKERMEKERREREEKRREAKREKIKENK